MNKCPECGSSEIYNSLFAVECPTPGCKNYSTKQAVASGLDVPADDEAYDAVADTCAAWPKGVLDVVGDCISPHTASSSPCGEITLGRHEMCSLPIPEPDEETKPGGTKDRYGKRGESTWSEAWIREPSTLQAAYDNDNVIRFLPNKFQARESVSTLKEQLEAMDLETLPGGEALREQWTQQLVEKSQEHVEKAWEIFPKHYVAKSELACEGEGSCVACDAGIPRTEYTVGPTVEVGDLRTYWAQMKRIAENLVVGGPLIGERRMIEGEVLKHTPKGWFPDPEYKDKNVVCITNNAVAGDVALGPDNKVWTYSQCHEWTREGTGDCYLPLQPTDIFRFVSQPNVTAKRNGRALEFCVVSGEALKQDEIEVMGTNSFTVEVTSRGSDNRTAFRISLGDGARLQVYQA